MERRRQPARITRGLTTVVQDHSPLAPEERRKHAASLSAAFGRDVAEKLRPHNQPFEVLKRIAVGVYTDGFIHAGNLAYLALLTLFPFVIVAAAVARLFGPVAWCGRWPRSMSGHNGRRGADDRMAGAVRRPPERVTITRFVSAR